MMKKRTAPSVAPEPREPLLSPDEAAVYLGMSKKALKVWVQLRKIEHVRFSKQVVRFKKSALDRYIARSTEPATER
jgi:excisionase family DNA binding protein